MTTPPPGADGAGPTPGSGPATATATLPDLPPVQAAPPAPPKPAPAAGGGTRAPRPPAVVAAPLSVYVSGMALSILAAFLLGLVAHVTVVSQLRYERAQQIAYTELRAQLANALAPTGQTVVDPLDPEAQPRLVAMGAPVALLEIPAIGLRTVVGEGTTSSVLADGPGHRRDTVLPGQAGTSVIMGRQAAYGGPFAELATLAPGTEFTVTTGQGEHGYRVLGVRLPGDPLPQPPAQDEGRLTLVTAHGRPFLPEDVLRVDAELVSEVQPAPGRVIAAGTLPPEEGTLAGDDRAWIAVVLYGQAVAIAAAVITWARFRWGPRQAWIVGAPVLGFLGLSMADQIARLLPNLL
ncbi:sortase [Allonocardiopsis opalescens]|uniref:LPXTG-site transpeptidase (Sortase) family protein n=1 Tax=Allonocardiopsis opalescens TaxID=1144618 RepID=A0A2T0PS80_9ACTN|nr:sortase [Allonocardiopsis opalescens]PRX91745.1 LPXTG-site transpeptidase (sortase) family protein [Allonocardiopsis opalescens]